MHILVFRPFQSSSLMITSQTTCMVRRRGRYSYNTHGSILKCSWRGRRMDGQSSTGTGLKLQRPSTWMKAQYSPSASAVFQMRCICVYTVYDDNFERFYMLHVKFGAGAVVWWGSWVLKLYHVVLWCISIMKSCFLNMEMEYIMCLIWMSIRLVNGLLIIGQLAR